MHVTLYLLMLARAYGPLRRCSAVSATLKTGTSNCALNLPAAVGALAG